jgi:D-3-phosphoglycerate dehydrogenase
MDATLEPLIVDLLEWIGQGRGYADVMDAWRTSCPRLPVWEEANLRGFVTQRRDAHGIEQVMLTEAGIEHLRRCHAGASAR